MWEVFACVEVFEKAGCGFEIGFEVDGGYGRGAVGGDLVDEELRFDEESLVGAESGFGPSGADVEGYDWGFEIAVGW